MTANNKHKIISAMSRFSVDNKLHNWMIDIRRHIHQYPELSFEEEETSAYICQKLDELGLVYTSSLGGSTGILASVGNGREGRCIALRADMDALPLVENTGLEFSSKNKGVMHACGHDGHVAMLLGAASLLKNMDLPGKIRLIFQPAEENGGGASIMINNGALKGVRAIIGGHIDRHFEVGEIAVQPGVICAFTDGFRIDISGKGGHAAKPHETVDSIVVASLLVMSIQTLVSREINPSFPTVITVGKFTGGTASNVIADHAVLEGTIRTTDPEVRDSIKNGLARMVRSMEGLYHAETEIRFIEGYPPVKNDSEISRLVRIAAEKTVGPERVMGLPYPSMGGEDFSFYLEHVPGCFVRFGAGLEGSVSAPAHSPTFDFDEKALATGASFLSRAAYETLLNIEQIPEKAG